MNIKKIFLSAVLCTAVICSFTACGNNGGEAPTNSKTVKLETIDPDNPITLKGTLLQQYMINHDIPQSDPNGYLLSDFESIEKLEFYSYRQYVDGGISISSDDFYPLTNDDIYDLRYCTNLQFLKIGNDIFDYYNDEEKHSDVTDLSSLAYLPNLQELYISRIGNADISVINNLKRLEIVDIDESNVDFSKLENNDLHKIEVNKCDCKITDFYKQFDTATEEKPFTLLAKECPNISFNQFKEAREKYPDQNVIKFK